MIRGKEAHIVYLIITSFYKSLYARHKVLLGTPCFYFPWQEICSQAFHSLSPWDFDISFGLTLHLNISFMCGVWLFHYPLLCMRLKRIVIWCFELLSAILVNFLP